MKTPTKQSFQDTATAILKWKFKTLKTNIRKKFSNKLHFHLKNQNKTKQKTEKKM